MAARKADHPLQRNEKRAGARLYSLPSATPGAGTRSALPVAHTAPLGVFKTAEALIAAG
jgi:hypothetical protein